MPGLPYTEKVRQQAIARVLDSRIPIVQVAREVGCSTDTMHRWLRQHRQQDALSPTRPQGNRPQNAPSVIVRKNRHTKTSPVAPPSPATFVPVHIIDPRSHSVEIFLPGDITLRLTDASPEYCPGKKNCRASVIQNRSFE